MTPKVEPSLIMSAIIRPLVRYCLSRGMKIHEIEQELHQVLTDEGKRIVEESIGESEEASVSKVSVVTGLNRPQVSKLLRGAPHRDTTSDILTRVVGQWQNDKRFSDGTAPRNLTCEGIGSEFADLVALVSREITHYPVLFELERIGAVTIENGLVQLVATEYIPVGDVSHGIKILSDDIEGLVSTVESNLAERRECPNLHLRTTFDNIRVADLENLRKWILKKGTEFHRAVNEHLATLDQDVNPAANSGGGEARRATVSVSAFASMKEHVSPIRILPKKRGRKRGSK